MVDRKIIIDAGGSSGVPAVHGYRPGAFVAKLITPSSAHIFWGMGRVLDLQVLNAHGLIAAVGHLSKEVEVDGLSPIEIICGHPGFWERLEHIWAAELSRAKKALNSDQHAVWRELATARDLLKLQAPRLPENIDEATELRKVKAERVRRAQDAVDLPQGFSGFRSDSRPA